MVTMVTSCILYHKVKANLQEVTIIPNPSRGGGGRVMNDDLYFLDREQMAFTLQFHQAS